MSGSAVPYALRHNKFVDRRIFIDLLLRILRWRSLDDYVYIGMGGNSLEDHKLVHAQLGITRMISFDQSDAVVARQKFNRPISTVECLEMVSSDLIPRLRGELERLQFGGDSPVIVWFDFTDPSKISRQIGEFVQLANTMSAGDVMRVTVNAHPAAIVDGRDPRLPNRERETLYTARLDELTRRLGDRMPPGIQPDSMSDERLPLVIMEAFRRAALDAFPAEDPNTFLPLSAVRYADGQQMLSITGIVLEKNHVDEFKFKTNLQTWPYFSAEWADVVSLSIPDLTIRERLLLDQVASDAPLDDVSQLLGFEFFGRRVHTEEVVGQYRLNRRFYPHFHYVST